jgi:hypothetical protein
MDNRRLLELAVRGLEIEREGINKEIALIMGQFNQPEQPAAGKRRVMSADGRRRISEAMKARWAAKRKGRKRV